MKLHSTPLNIYRILCTHI